MEHALLRTLIVVYFLDSVSFRRVNLILDPFELFEDHFLRVCCDKLIVLNQLTAISLDLVAISAHVFRYCRSPCIVLFLRRLCLLKSCLLVALHLIGDLLAINSQQFLHFLDRVDSRFITLIVRTLCSDLLEVLGSRLLHLWSRLLFLFLPRHQFKQCIHLIC